MSSNFDFAKAFKHIKRVERKYIKDLIGAEQYALLTGFNGTAENDVVWQVRELFKEASASYTMIFVLPVINAKITNSGTRANKNDEAEKSSWAENRDLLRNYLATATEAIDAALELMESNLDKFSLWVASAKFTVFNELFVKHTSEFTAGFYIGNSRTTFLSLRSYIKEVEEQYLQAMLGDCYLVLKTTSTDGEVKRAQELARLAVVALTVAKVATTGTFLFTSNSMTVYSEELPWDKNKFALSESQLEKLQTARQTAGEEYLKKLKKHLLAYPAKFPCYQDKTNIGLDARIIKKNSALFI